MVVRAKVVVVERERSNGLKTGVMEGAVKDQQQDAGLYCD